MGPIVVVPVVVVAFVGVVAVIAPANAWRCFRPCFGRSQSFAAGPPTSVQFTVKDSQEYAATAGIRAEAAALRTPASFREQGKTTVFLADRPKPEIAQSRLGQIEAHA